ncbi:MAG TPA: EAL domain-containing protein [Burkholderiaceae bacterium]|nr:EAL domain-containing protein [Burkholderiaceae bacterium]
MSAIASAPSASPSAPWWARLHCALMPDYNRKAAVYWWSVVTLGVATLIYALLRVATLPLEAVIQVVIGVAITMLAGLFPVRIPRSKNSFAAGEIFIFLLLLMHGPAAATVASACEACVGSWRTSSRWTSRIASPAMAAVAMFLTGSLLNVLAATMKSHELLGEGALLALSMLFAIIYFLVNTLLVTLVPHLKRNQPLVLREWLGSFGWVGIAYAGSASVAALLFLTFQQVGLGVLLAAAPIIAMLLATLHFYFRQQETDEQVRRARVEAAEREAAQAARHVEQLAESERRFHSAFTHASIGMALVSVSGAVLQVNRALCTLLGHDESDVVGHRFAEFLFAEDAGILQEQIARVTKHDVESMSVELRCRHRRGREVWVSLHCGFFSGTDVGEACLILQVQDITARRRAEGRLQHIAYHDGLTDLANRSRFNECLMQAIDRCEEHPRCQFAVMYLDFDRFKLINDSLGHGAGDEFLVKVARRIQEHVRPTDIVARLGGDEFAILTENVVDEAHVVVLAERLQEVLRKPFLISGTEIATSASIGITFSRLGYRTPDEVLRDADIAMYHAKACGKARYAIFDACLRDQVTDQLHLEGDLRRALESGTGGLSVSYQPIYRLATNELVAFEALARWNHAERGPVDPTVFIPIAEESGLIVPLTYWVIEESCRQLKAWQLRGSKFADLRMHVNISGFGLAQTAFVNSVTRTLLTAGVQPGHLTLEITESTLMAHLENAVDTMTQLRELGIGLSVDDFGTGYSSLNYLSSLPINSLKIDRSFVEQLQASVPNSEIVRAVVTLGGSLGKSVIAEGIETPAQLQRLREVGCEYGQGFLLARPLPAAQSEALFEARAAGSPLSARPQLVDCLAA